MKVKIYILKDPNTYEIRYVGKSIDVNKRYIQHLNKHHNLNSKKREWIDSLLEKGLKPKLEIIKEVEKENGLKEEKDIILLLRRGGHNLLNCGEDNFFGNSTAFKIGNEAIKIVAITKEGKYFKTFNSQVEAENTIGSKGIDGVLCGNRKTCGGYIWLKEEIFNRLTEEELETIVENANEDLRGLGEFSIKSRFKKGRENPNKGKILGPNLKKDIFQYEVHTGKLLTVWASAREAAFQINGNEDAITACARGQSKTSAGFKWSYLKKENIYD